MILRALCLMLLFSAGQAVAHALPGSTIVAQIKEGTLDLTVQVARDDLVIAAPDLAWLEDLPHQEALAAPLHAAFGAYFSAHLHVMHEGEPLLLTLRDVSLVTDHHDHVGQFLVVKSHWQAATPSPGDLLLRYDAVMHEVRNHRATVIWRTSQGDTTLGRLAFHGPSDGILLPAAKAGHE